MTNQNSIQEEIKCRLKAGNSCYYSVQTQAMVFENRILRRIFGPKRDENGEWRRLHNEEFHSFYPSPNIVRAIKSRMLIWASHVARMEEDRSAFKMFKGKHTGK